MRTCGVLACAALFGCAGPAMALLISSPPAAGSAEELEAHIKALTSAHAGEPSNESGNNQ